MFALQGIVAATVYGREVSLYDLLHFLKTHDKLACLHEALEGLVVSDAITTAGITVSAAELQEAMDHFRRTHGLYKAADTFAWLQQHRLTVPDLESRLEYTLATAKFREQMTALQVERYFAEHCTTFDAVEIAHIVVAKEGMASEIFSQITEEEADFTALARLHSTDEATRCAGGYVGIVKRQTLSPAVEAAVFAAPPETVIGPVKTDRGYHIIQVQALYPAHLDTPTRAAIQDLLYTEWLQQAMQQARLEPALLQQL